MAYQKCGPRIVVLLLLLLFSLSVSLSCPSVDELNIMGIEPVVQVSFLEWPVFLSNSGHDNGIAPRNGERTIMTWRVRGR